MGKHLFFILFVLLNLNITVAQKVTEYQLQFQTSIKLSYQSTFKALKLQNGTSFISYKEAFKNLVSHNEGVNITITPTGETNGVFISKVTSEGFYVKENLNGNSNASFNWTAIGTRKGYENGIELSNVVLSNEFDKNMNEVMTNDGGDTEGKSIYYDGTTVKFERIPDGMVKYNSKKPNTKK